LAAAAAAAALEAAGLGARPVRPPTVPEGTSRVRLSFHADHPQDVADRVIDAVDRFTRGRP
jgi:8-amino-7-oxononanoate synthase